MSDVVAVLNLGDGGDALWQLFETVNDKTQVIFLHPVGHCGLAPHDNGQPGSDIQGEFVRKVIAQVVTENAIACGDAVAVPYESPTTMDGAGVVALEHTTIFNMWIGRKIDVTLQAIEIERQTAERMTAQGGKELRLPEISSKDNLVVSGNNVVDGQEIIFGIVVENMKQHDGSLHAVVDQPIVASARYGR